RQFHPLRFQRWAISDLNPWCAWLGPAAQAVKAQRQALPAEDPLRKIETLNAELISASMDYQRAVRDATSEAAFFTTYANIFLFHLAEQHAAEERAAELPADVRERPFVKDALAAIAKGGYTEAFARVAYLLGRKGEPLPLSRLTMRQELAKDYAYLLPDLSLDQWRRIRGEQEIIVRNEPDKAIETLPRLLDEDERLRLMTLIDRVVTDKRVIQSKPTAEQLAMLDRVRKVLSTERPRAAEDSSAKVGVAIQSMEGSRHESQT
ncbi:MAG: DUF3141 domain-containing protein, partial [Burkholderiales bacterium]